MRYSSFLLSFTYAIGTVCAEPEFRLITDLMKRYDPDVRPSENVSQPVEIVMDITLHQIVELVGKQSLLL